MQINVSFEALKKFGIGLFVLAGLFSLGTSISYLRFRQLVNPLLAAVEFDVNSRASEIRAKYLALQAKQAEAAAKAVEATKETPAPAEKEGKK